MQYVNFTDMPDGGTVTTQPLRNKVINKGV
jgi:hypothetical protein